MGNLQLVNLMGLVSSLECFVTTYLNMLLKRLLLIHCRKSLSV